MILSRRALGAALAFGCAARARAAAGPEPAQLAQTIRLVQFTEITGPASGAGLAWRNGVEMAAQEINGAGGLFGQLVSVTTFDTQSTAGGAAAAAHRALDGTPFQLVLGPVTAAATRAVAAVARQARLAQIAGADAPDLGTPGAPLLRTALSQSITIPRLVRWLRDSAKPRRVAVLSPATESGRPGHDIALRELHAAGIEAGPELAIQPGAEQAPDFAKLAGADAALVLLDGPDCLRLLRDAHRGGLRTPLVGLDALAAQRVIDAAGPAANGVRAHVGLCAEAPALATFRDRYATRYHDLPDAAAMAGYVAVAMFKAAAEKLGRIDRAALADALRQPLTVAQAPGVLVDSTWNAAGDIDHDSWIVEVRDGRQTILETLPAGRG